MFEQVFNGMMTDPSTHAMSALGESMVEPFSEGLHSSPVRKSPAPRQKTISGKLQFDFTRRSILRTGIRREFTESDWERRGTRDCARPPLFGRRIFPLLLAVGRRRFRGRARGLVRPLHPQHQIDQLFLGKAFQISAIHPRIESPNELCRKGVGNCRSVSCP